MIKSNYSPFKDIDYELFMDATNTGLNIGDMKFLRLRKVLRDINSER